MTTTTRATKTADSNRELAATDRDPYFPGAILVDAAAMVALDAIDITIRPRSKRR
jgi:hypothetical protein